MDPSPMHSQRYRLLQSFGEKRSTYSLEDEDLLSAVSFDHTGDFACVGDQAGRLVIFKLWRGIEDYQGEKAHKLKYKRISSIDFSLKDWDKAIEYEYLMDYQSHTKEFDYMKSEEIDQKINYIRFLHSNGKTLNLISSNSKTIKLWRITEKNTIKRGLSFSNDNENIDGANSPKETNFVPKQKQEYFKLHKYAINSVSITKNDAFIITSDDLKIYLWSIEQPNSPFCIVDKTPFLMEDLSEVITSSELNKNNDNLFLFTTSMGTINMCDLRKRALCEGNAEIFKNNKKIKDKIIFGEILNSVSHATFSVEDHFIIARDYLSIKIWDIRNNKDIYKEINIYEPIKSQLAILYENEQIFDKFKISIGKNNNILTGNYNDSFHILDWKNENNFHFNIMENDEIDVRWKDSSPININQKFNIDSRILKHEFHPKRNCFALCCQNCVYIFGSDM